MLQWFDDLKRILDLKIKMILEEFKAMNSPSEEDEELLTFWTCVPTEKLTVITSHEALALDFTKQAQVIP